MSCNDKLQELCRSYLTQLRPLAERFGLGGWVDETLRANVRKECSGTEEECELLARACHDDRIARTDVPKILGKSYRRCVEDEDFEKLRTLPHVGIYSKISTLLFKEKSKK